jgi:hypothetical protein
MATEDATAAAAIAAAEALVIMDDEEDDDMADLFSFGSGEASGAGNDALDDDSLHPAPYRRTDSGDSFLDLLQDAPELLSSGGGVEGSSSASHDAETTDLLAWLDEESPTLVEKEPEEEAPKEEEAPSKASPVITETVVVLPPVFTTLTAALASPQATVGQIRTLAEAEASATETEPGLSALQRPDVYCRLLTGKWLAEAHTQSSLVDSFVAWQTAPDREVVPEDASLDVLAARITKSLAETYATHRDKEACRQDLRDVWQFYARGGSNASDRDVLLPPVTATLLGFGIPTAVVSLLLSRVVPQHIPLLALQATERWEAATGLHQHLYWLACYHLPLLVFHLDRYCPGWCGPRISATTAEQEAPTVQARHLASRGCLPSSWLLSLLSGDEESSLPPAWMGPVWDWILTAEMSRSVPFFLALAVLERAADDLMLLTGETLRRGLVEAFVLDDQADRDWLATWWPAAQALRSATPASVLEQLDKAEDEAVQQTLIRRQERVEAEATAKLAAQAAAYQEAQELRAEQARKRLTRARLVAFYRKHAPDKEGNIDTILETYANKLEILEAKLFKKYGESFNPSIPTRKASATTRKVVGSEEVVPVKHIEALAASKTDQVSVLVKASEVLPVICWSKEAATMRGANRRSRRPHAPAGLPLRFFLVDSRSEEAAEDQGRFPTSVSLGPEAMLDPDRLQKNEERFESLRGAIHIVVMGEGFSAIPKLYDQKLSPKLKEAMTQDDSRTNICALFFVKKGFPFVSILDGGFAAAHSWLVREGPSHHLETSSVLLDYDAERSLFGQMEKLHGASTTEKAQRAMAGLMEKSLVAMTIQARQFERLANDMEQNAGRFGGFFGANRAKAPASKTTKTDDSKDSKGPRFVNPFANKANTEGAGATTEAEKTQSGGSRFGNMFARGKSFDEDEGTHSKPPAVAAADEAATPALTVPFRNPFGRRQAEDEEEKAVPPPPTATSPESTDDTTDTATTATAGAAARPAMANPFKGFGAALSNTMNRTTEVTEAGATTPVAAAPTSAKATADEGEKRNVFKGFGAAFGSAAKSSDDNKSAAGAAAGVSNVLKRNPFRGFGGAKKGEEKKGGGFGGGLGALRVNMGLKPKDQDGATTEESVSFG